MLGGSNKWKDVIWTIKEDVYNGHSIRLSKQSPNATLWIWSFLAFWLLETNYWYNMDQKKYIHFTLLGCNSPKKKENSISAPYPILSKVSPAIQLQTWSLYAFEHPYHHHSTSFHMNHAISSIVHHRLYPMFFRLEWQWINSFKDFQNNQHVYRSNWPLSCSRATITHHQHLCNTLAWKLQLYTSISSIYTLFYWILDI